MTGSVKPSKIRERFESLAKQEEEEAKRKAEEEKQRRIARDLEEREESKRQEEQRLKQLKAGSEVQNRNEQVSEPEAQNHHAEQVITKDTQRLTNNSQSGTLHDNYQVCFRLDLYYVDCAIPTIVKSVVEVVVELSSNELLI